jgi:hypothetical protein
MPAILALVQRLQAVGPPSMPVGRLAARGLWRPRLWRHLQPVGWHPGVRLQHTTSLQPQGQGRCPVRTLGTGPGQAWVGRGIASKAGAKRQVGTVLVVWDVAHSTPWVLLPDLLPGHIGVCWYGLRVWIALGFRALKGIGWPWHHTRRSDPTRGARHWLVLAGARLWVLAYGTRAEDAAQPGVAPAQLVQPTAPPASRRRRGVSVLRRGLQALRQTLGRGYLGRRRWRVPEPWPEPPPNLLITYHTGP